MEEKEKGGIYLKKGNVWPVEEKEKEENIWKIFGKGRRRRTEKDREENILEKESDDGPTNKQTDRISSCIYSTPFVEGVK